MFLKLLFPEQQYTELRQQMTDLYYEQNWKEIEMLYNNSTLPKITIDLDMLQQLKELNAEKSNLIKNIINWEHSNNKDVEWIMNFIMKNAYLNFEHVKKIIYGNIRNPIPQKRRNTH